MLITILSESAVSARVRQETEGEERKRAHGDKWLKWSVLGELCSDVVCCGSGRLFASAAGVT